MGVIENRKKFSVVRHRAQRHLEFGPGRTVLEKKKRGQFDALNAQ